MSAPKAERQDVHGIVLLDKPTGMSSNKALQIVKRALNAKKAGHTGALDPLATGLLPLCFGQATKLADYMLGQDKTYLVTAKLGERTTTSDSDGEIISSKPIPDLTEQQIEKYLENFRGPINQTPSMYSALKYQGKPYYYYARKGIEIDRVTRQVTIFDCSLVAFTKDNLTLSVRCSKGTYIRTLIDDLGELIGCGAHVTMLRRIDIDGVEGQMVALSEFETGDLLAIKQYLSSPDDVINCDTYQLTEQEVEDIYLGHLKQVVSQSSNDLLALKSKGGTVYAYAQRTERDRFNITRRFIFGFGHTEPS